MIILAQFYYGIFAFVINNSLELPVQTYSNFLRVNIWLKLVETLEIRPIRLSNILIDHNGTDLVVSFTLVDNPPFYGPVVNPLKELSLDAVVTKLRALIDKGNITFPGVYNNTHGIILYPKPGSLNVVARTPITVLINNMTMISYEAVTNTTNQIRRISKQRKSGGRITGFWIGFLALGIVLGLLGALVIAKVIAARKK